MNPTLKETLELAENKLRRDYLTRSTNLILFQKTSSFTHIFSLMRTKNDTLILKYLKLVIIQKKDWKILLVRTLHYNTIFRQYRPIL